MAGYFILSTRKGDYRALAFQGSQSMPATPS